MTGSGQDPTPPASHDAACLCVFARAPLAGGVKRRLAASIGDREALAAHVRLVGEAIDRLAGSMLWRTELWLAGPEPDALAAWPQCGNLARRAQQGDDLGARMHHALTATLHSAGRVVLVGTDCPQIDADYGAAAFDALEDADVVLGPAEDGGYGLVGARRRVRDRLAPLFSDMPWGTDRVLGETLARCRRADLAVARLPLIWDVDDLEDWRRYLAWVAQRGAL